MVVLAAVVCWLGPGRAAAQQPPAAAGRPAAASAGATELSLATLLARARAGEVVSARIDDLQRTVSGELVGGGRYRAEYPVDFADELTTRLLAAGVDVGVGQVPAADAGSAADPLVVLLVLLVVALLVAAVGPLTPPEPASGARVRPPRQPRRPQRLVEGLLDQETADLATLRALVAGSTAAPSQAGPVR